jgi:hypothetical protein
MGRFVSGIRCTPFTSSVFFLSVRFWNGVRPAYTELHRFKLSSVFGPRWQKSWYLLFYSVTSGNPSLGMTSSVRLQQMIVRAIALSLLSIILKFIWRLYIQNILTKFKIWRIIVHQSTSFIKLSIFLCLVDIF